MKLSAPRAGLLAVSVALFVQANACGGDAARADSPVATSDAVTADGGAATTPDAGPGGALFAMLVQELDAERVRAGAPAGQLAIIVDGKLAFSAGVGTLRRDSRDLVDDRTLFQWASVSKMFTAATVMSLVDDGTIALDAPVTRYVPYAHCAPPAQMDAVTVQDVLTHTSGLRDGFFQPPANGTAATSLQDVFHADAPPLVSTPGAVWVYSDYGYALAGLVAQEAAGTPFTELVKQRILGNAGMETATFDPAEAAKRRHAVGVSRDLLDIDTDSEWGDVFTRPWGGLQASVVDVAHWVETLLAGGGAALRKESVARMTSPQVAIGDGRSYGYGFFVENDNGREVVTHDGGQSGFTSFVAMVPASRFGVVAVLSQSDAKPWLVASHAIDVFLGQ